MKNKLLLTLWLVGGLLYTGSTIFLAQAVLGGAGGATDDKSKATTLAAADTQCPKEDVAAGEAVPTKPDATKTAAIEPKKTVAAPAAQKQPAQGAATREVTPPTGDADEREAQSGPWPGADQDQAYRDQDPSFGNDAASLDDWQGREAPLPGAGEDAAEVEEWASVVAGTADMRAEPDLRSPMVYALLAGWQVRVISRQPGWVQVQDAHSGAAGWVESSALAPSGGPGPQPGYGGYDPRYGNPDRYANEGYPEEQPWQRQRRPRTGQFGDFFRRALGGF